MSYSLPAKRHSALRGQADSSTGGESQEETQHVATSSDLLNPPEEESNGGSHQKIRRQYRRSKGSEEKAWVTNEWKLSKGLNYPLPAKRPSELRDHGMHLASGNPQEEMGQAAIHSGGEAAGNNEANGIVNSHPTTSSRGLVAPLPNGDLNSGHSVVDEDTQNHVDHLSEEESWEEFSDGSDFDSISQTTGYSFYKYENLPESTTQLEVECHDIPNKAWKTIIIEILRDVCCFERPALTYQEIVDAVKSRYPAFQKGKQAKKAEMSPRNILQGKWMHPAIYVGRVRDGRRTWAIDRRIYDEMRAAEIRAMGSKSVESTQNSRPKTPILQTAVSDDAMRNRLMGMVDPVRDPGFYYNFQLSLPQKAPSPNLGPNLEPSFPKRLSLLNAERNVEFSPLPLQSPLPNPGLNFELSRPQEVHRKEKEPPVAPTEVQDYQKMGTWNNLPNPARNMELSLPQKVHRKEKHPPITPPVEIQDYHKKLHEIIDTAIPSITHDDDRVPAAIKLGLWRRSMERTPSPLASANYIYEPTSPTLLSPTSCTPPREAVEWEYTTADYEWMANHQLREEREAAAAKVQKTNAGFETTAPGIEEPIVAEHSSITSETGQAQKVAAANDQVSNLAEDTNSEVKKGAAEMRDSTEAGRTVIDLTVGEEEEEVAAANTQDSNVAVDSYFALRTGAARTPEPLEVYLESDEWEDTDSDAGEPYADTDAFGPW